MGGLNGWVGGWMDGLFPLYWIVKYLPGVMEDYKAKNGDVSPSTPPTHPTLSSSTSFKPPSSPLPNPPTHPPTQLRAMVLQKDGDIAMKDKAMEEAREFGGATILLLYTLVIYPLSFPKGGKGKVQ